MSDDQERDLYTFLRDCYDSNREAVATRCLRRLFERLNRPDLVAVLDTDPSPKAHPSSASS